MPIYEYECQACGHEFEVMQKITSGPVRKCESCGQRKVRRLISHTSFKLKGGGWYADLYGSSSSKDKSAASTTTTTSAEKPAAKTKTETVAPAKKGADK